MTIGAGITVKLPGGVWSGDCRVQTAEMRELTGLDEEWLQGAGGTPLGERVTEMLSRCLLYLGDKPATVEQVRGLSIGDRESLLLQLRRLTLGERIDCMLRCPDEACGERIDIDLRVSDLLLPSYDDFPAWHEETLKIANSAFNVRFRLPTGADQEAVAALAFVQPEAAAAWLLSRCVDRLVDSEGQNVREEPPPDVVGAVGARMVALDPQAELSLNLVCPACERPIEVLFDTGAYFFAELSNAAPRLSEEIHILAWYYHWSEPEILDLTRCKRRRYVKLISDTLSRATAGVPA